MHAFPHARAHTHTHTQMNARRRPSPNSLRFTDSCMFVDAAITHRSLKHTRTFNTRSHTHTRSHSFTHSLRHSLTHSPTLVVIHSRMHSLTHSLTHTHLMHTQTRARALTRKCTRTRAGQTQAMHTWHHFGSRLPCRSCPARAARRQGLAAMCQRARQGPTAFWGPLWPSTWPLLGSAPLPQV